MQLRSIVVTCMGEQGKVWWTQSGKDDKNEKKGLLARWGHMFTPQSRADTCKQSSIGEGENFVFRYLGVRELEVGDCLGRLPEWLNIKRGRLKSGAPKPGVAIIDSLR